MQQSTKIKEYLKNVCEQIRWKTAHESVSQELENHIMDQKDAYVREGLDEEVATDMAIKQMGDPISIGMQLDRTHRPKPEWSIILLTGILLLMGFVIRIFITTGTEFSWMISKSIVWTIIGIACMVGTYFLDFTVIGRYPKKIFFGFLVVALVICPYSIMVNGEYVNFQFLYLFFPTVFAGIVYSMRNKGYSGIILSGLYFAVFSSVGMMLMTSRYFVYLFAGILILTLAIKKGYFAVNKLKALFLIYMPTFLGCIIILFKISQTPYQWERLRACINPSNFSMASGYTTMQTSNILNSSKLFGPGELALDAPSMLPNVYDVSLLTYVIQKFGWISFVIIISVISLFIIRCIMLCTKQKSVLGKLVSTSIIITITMEVVLFVVYNLGFQLITPLVLPFVSYGGNATITNMFLVGMMLSVFRTGDLMIEKNIASEKSKLFEYTEGKIIINLKPKKLIKFKKSSS